MGEKTFDGIDSELYESYSTGEVSECSKDQSHSLDTARVLIPNIIQQL